LALAVDCDTDCDQDQAIRELLLWVGILREARKSDDAVTRDAAIHALRLRQVPEACAILAVADVQGALYLHEEGGPDSPLPSKQLDRGTVTKFENGFGFIRVESGGPDAFVHHTQIQGRGFRTLTEGSRVAFDLEKGPRGLAAVRVRELFAP
jgi:cold shock protein